MATPLVEIDRFSTSNLDKITVCFGGFNPMALSDSPASRTDVERAYQMMAEQRAAGDRARQLERARTSSMREYVDDEGTTWSYVVLDKEYVRIMKCETTLESMTIPAEMCGLPVLSLGADSFAKCLSLREIICPDDVYDIGLRSFLDCKNLERLVLPASCANFSSQWYRGCPNIVELVLPGLLGKIEAPMFECPKLKTLVVGQALSEIGPATFEKMQLENIVISESNPYIMTDGNAIYLKDGSGLISLVRHVSSYKILDGCRAIAKKAFYSMKCLEEVVLPETMEVLGDFCFGRTSLSRIELPAAVTKVGEKAFFYCEKLTSMKLDEGLLELGDEAFSHTALTELLLPSSIEHIGKSVALHSKVTYSGPCATFKVSPASPTLSMDEGGGLYRKEEDGLHFVRLMDPFVEQYKVLEGTVQIDTGSFTAHDKIVRVALPASVRIIAAGAFKNCRRLAECMVAPTLERIDAEAFMDTALESFVIPAGLQRLGELALVTKGSHTGVRPTLRKIEVQEGNKKYFMHSGMLCERFESGRCRVVMFDNSCESVSLLPETYSIAAYAFSGVDCVREMVFSDAIQSIEICGLKMCGLVEHMHIDLQKPYKGHEFYDIYFPQTDRGAHDMQLALSVPDHVDLPNIFMHYDGCIANASSQSSMIVDKTMDMYEQATRILARLKDPVYMTGPNKMMLESFIRNNIEEACVAIARKDDRSSIDILFDLGYLTEDNLLGIIERVGRLQDAAMTGYLLEKKHELFKPDFLDFDL